MSSFFHRLAILVTLRRVLVFLLLLALLYVGVVSLGRLRTADFETVRVTQGTIVEEVPANGRVEPESNVNLSFQYGGRVAAVSVSVGDVVASGNELVTLEAGTLSDELARVRAELSVRIGSTGSSEVNLERIRSEQDTLVQNAYRKLLSEGLEAVSATSEQYAVAPPVITGLYEGEPGTYRLVIRREIDGRNRLTVLNLERVQGTVIETGRPAPVGTRGLFVSFPDDPSLYHDTVWHVNIPNAASAAYAANYNAYQQALQMRERVIAEAEASLRSQNGGQTIASAQAAAARAAVERVEREISDRSLRAAFSGVVTRVDAREGETVIPGQTVVSVMPEGVLQVSANVSENNIVNVRPGQRVKVVLDALERETLFGVVARIDPAESVVSGAVYYRTTVLFDRADPRIRSGMTANVWIETAVQDNALLLPVSAVRTDADGEFVSVLGPDGQPHRRDVATGLRGRDGSVEIISGLSLGEEVVIGGYVH